MEDVIAFQARWTCELQRRNFPDLQARDDALTQALAEDGIGRSAYEELLAEMPESQELRDQVLSLYQERCRA